MKATQTVLTSLEVTNLGMGDEGLAALANLISQGRLQEVKTFDFISSNYNLTDEGILALAQAIDAGGLPMLGNFSMGEQEVEGLTVVGISAILQAVISGCPYLRIIGVTRPYRHDTDIEEMVKGMVQAVGREGQVYVGDTW